MLYDLTFTSKEIHVLDRLCLARIRAVGVSDEEVELLSAIIDKWEDYADPGVSFSDAKTPMISTLADLV